MPLPYKQQKNLPTKQCRQVNILRNLKIKTIQIQLQILLQL